MADNVQVNEATSAGAVVAADDVAGVLHQRVKIEVGADGTATQVTGGAGDADAGTVRVALANDDTAKTTLTAIDGHVDGIETLLTAIDGHVDGLETSAAAQATAAKQDTAQTTLTAIDGHVDGIETLLIAIDGHVDGLEGATGATTDAAVTTDANGSHSAFLRGIVTILGAVVASPVANTIGARLKTIADAITGTLTVNASITDSPAQAAPGAGSSFGNSKQLKASAGYLLGFSVHNKGSSTLYVALYNAASKTGTALMYWPVYAADTISVSFGEIGLYLDTGGFLQAVTDHDGTDTSDATSSLKFMGRMI